MLVIGLLAVAAAVDDAADAPTDFEPDHYMTEAKARRIADEKLPASQRDFDTRLGMIKSTSVFQLGKIERLIPLALLQNDDMAAAGQKVSLLDCVQQLGTFATEKTQDLERVHDDLQKLKGTVVDFQLIDDMANDPSHPWIHSATYNKTSVSRKKDAIAKLLQSWIQSMNTELEHAAMEYIPPFDVSLQNLTAAEKPPPASRAWIEAYTQSERIIMVMAQLLKKFSPQGMTEGLRISSAPLVAPVNVKDYLDSLQLAARKVGDGVKHALAQGLSGKPETASSLLETHTELLDASFTEVNAALEQLRVVVLRERQAAKLGFLPKASGLLLAYGKVVNALNNANNSTRTALQLPPTFLSQRSELGQVYNAILKGDMAKAFYGKKLGQNQTVEDWGIKASVGADGAMTFTSSLVESDKQKAYDALRGEFEKRTPGYAAYNETEFLHRIMPQSHKAGLVPKRLRELYNKIMTEHKIA